MKSLLLDNNAWDLVTDIDGNIACATEPYAIAQDVACAVRLFKGELWYNTAAGIPYFEEILGKWPPMPLVQEYVVRAAMTVPGVEKARCIILSFKERTLVGQVQVIDTDGVEHNVNF